MEMSKRQKFGIISFLIIMGVIVPFAIKRLLACNDTSFYGTYYGSFVGASMTLFGVFITLRHSDKKSHDHEQIEKKINIRSSIYLDKYKSLNKIMGQGHYIATHCDDLKILIGDLDNDLMQGSRLIKGDSMRFSNVLEKLSDFIGTSMTYETVDLSQIKMIANNSNKYYDNISKYSNCYQSALNKLFLTKEAFSETNFNEIGDIKRFLRKSINYISTIKENLCNVIKLIPKLEVEQENKIENS